MAETPEEIAAAAVEEVIDEIERHCVVRLHLTELRALPLESAKTRWRTRYYERFLCKIKEGGSWEKDKNQVLLRARQVGFLAAFLANLDSVFDELLRSGVGHEPGQDIDIEPTRMPKIDTEMAEWAAKCIDCVKQGPPGPRWDWCTRTETFTTDQLARMVLTRAAANRPKPK